MADISVYLGLCVLILWSVLPPSDPERHSGVRAARLMRAGRIEVTAPENLSWTEMNIQLPLMIREILFERNTRFARQLS